MRIFYDHFIAYFLEENSLQSLQICRDVLALKDFKKGAYAFTLIFAVFAYQECFGKRQKVYSCSPTAQNITTNPSHDGIHSMYLESVNISVGVEFILACFHFLFQ